MFCSAVLTVEIMKLYMLACCCFSDFAALINVIVNVKNDEAELQKQHKPCNLAKKSFLPRLHVDTILFA